jgi:hypothetical protein
MARRDASRYLARNLRFVGSEWVIIGFGFGKAAFAGKTSKWNASGSYRLSRLERKPARDLFDRVAGEAAAGEASKECRRDAFALDQPSYPIELGLESSDRGSSRFGWDQASPEIGLDRGIAVAATCEQFGAALGQTPVVEDPVAPEGRKRILSRSGRMSGAFEALLESPPRAGARRE